MPLLQTLKQPIGDTLMHRRTFILATSLIALASTASAQGWPEKTIRFVVPFPAGGPLDSVARTLAEAVSVKLGQAIVVENKAGAVGTIGTENVVRSPADGYSVLLGFSGGHALTPSIMSLRFDPLKDVPPLLGLARSELVLVSGKRAKGQSITDFIKVAKDKDNLVGGIGTGSTNHLVGELFKRATGIKGTHVPYQGAAPLSIAVMVGEVDFAVLDVGAVLPYIQAGSMVPLAVASAKRSSFLPDVPTFVEAGVAGVMFENVYGAFLPAGVPREVQNKLGQAISFALDTPAVKTQFGRLGVVPLTMGADQLDAVIRHQAATLVPVAHELNIYLK